MYTQKSTEYALISAGEHDNKFSCILYHVYITKNGMSLIQQEKNENVFFSWTAYMFPLENEYNLIVWALVLLKKLVAEMCVHRALYNLGMNVF